MTFKSGLIHSDKTSLSLLRTFKWENTVVLLCKILCIWEVVFIPIPNKNKSRSKISWFLTWMKRRSICAKLKRFSLSCREEIKNFLRNLNKKFFSIQTEVKIVISLQFVELKYPMNTECSFFSSMNISLF